MGIEGILDQLEQRAVIAANKKAANDALLKKIAENTKAYEVDGLTIFYNGLEGEYTVTLNDTYFLAIRHVCWVTKGAIASMIADPVNKKQPTVDWTSDGTTYIARIVLTKNYKRVDAETRDANFFFFSESGARAFLQWTEFGDIAGLALRAITTIAQLWKDEFLIKNGVTGIAQSAQDMLTQAESSKAVNAFFSAKARTSDFKFQIEQESMNHDEKWIKRFSWLDELVAFFDKTDPIQMDGKQLSEIAKYIQKKLPRG